ncbi:TPA: hypothetical protein ACP32N_005053 [Pseudomonas aeruginosa]
MPRTIESIVENHRVARERRAAGKSQWDRTINIKAILHEDQSNESNDHVANVANRIGALIRQSVPTSWLEYGNEATDDELIEVVEGMEALKPNSYEGEKDFTPLDDLNSMLDQLYDWADSKRIWLG